MPFILALLMIAASGDLLVRTTKHTEISQQQAISIAACYKATGSFTGANGRVQWCKLSRGGSTGYATDCAFDVPTHKDSVTYPVQIEGVEP